MAGAFSFDLAKGLGCLKCILEMSVVTRPLIQRHFDETGFLRRRRQQNEFFSKAIYFIFNFSAVAQKNFFESDRTRRESGNFTTMSIPGEADYSSPKLRGYLEVKHCPTNGRSRARIPRKVRHLTTFYLLGGCLRGME